MTRFDCGLGVAGHSLGSLVLVMAVERIDAVSRVLTQYGRDPQIPVHVVENGTLPTERVFTVTPATAAGEVVAAGIRPGATVIIGDVVDVAREIEVLRSTRDAGRAP